MYRRTLLAAALVASLVVVSCSAPAADPRADAPASGDIAEVASVPNPLDVRVSLDSDRSASAVIGPEGGEVSATSAGGTTFTLNVPADALAGERSITLTPIETISDYPFAAPPAAGVHMEPEGLRFFAPATLQIEGAPPISSDELVGFGYSGTGADFHVVPVAATSSGFAFGIWHFSGVGVGAATDAELAAQQDRAPADYEAQMTQELALLISRERSCVIIGLCEDAESDGGGVNSTLTDEENARAEELVEGWEEVVERTAEAGRTNCEAHKRAAGMMALHERQWAILGVDQASELTTALADSLEEGARNCIVEAYEKCRTEHDLGQFAAMYEAVRVSEIVGTGASDLVAFADEAGSKCATFEIEYEAAVATQPHFPHYRYEVHATVPLTAAVTSTGHVTAAGSAPLEITDWYNWSHDPCAPTTVSQPASEAPFEVRESEWTWSTAGTKPRTITQLVVAVDPGAVAQTATSWCGEDDVFTVEAGPFYRMAFLYLHRTPATAGAPDAPTKITFAPGDILGGELYARKAYQMSVPYPDGTLDGDFVFELWHRPPPLDDGDDS